MRHSASPAWCCPTVLGGRLQKADAEQVAIGFKAIADPGRLQLLNFIAAQPSGEACVCHSDDAARRRAADGESPPERALRSRFAGARATRHLGILPHRSGTTCGILGESFAYLITVCDSAQERCPVFPGAVKRLHWLLRDPAAATGSEAERTAVFRQVGDEIEPRIRAWLES
jgi:protein-tyrosine-phosphatase